MPKAGGREGAGLGGAVGPGLASPRLALAQRPLLSPRVCEACPRSCPPHRVHCTRASRTAVRPERFPTAELLVSRSCCLPAGGGHMQTLFLTTLPLVAQAPGLCQLPSPPHLLLGGPSTKISAQRPHSLPPSSRFPSLPPFLFLSLGLQGGGGGQSHPWWQSRGGRQEVREQRFCPVPPPLAGGP